MKLNDRIWVAAKDGSILDVVWKDRYASDVILGLSDSDDSRFCGYTYTNPDTLGYA